MIRILFTMVKISDEGNAYGFNRIDIIALNYDGDWGAIARNDDSETLDYYALIDLELVMFGDPGTGERWYKVAD